MATTPIIHEYREINIGKYTTVRHFELLNTKGGAPQLSKTLNLAKNRDFAKSSPLFWLKERKGNKWKKQSTTGLFKTGFTRLLRGDVNQKTHLVVFKFNDEVCQLTVYYFKNEFRYDIDSFLQKIREGYYEQKKTA